MVGPRNINIKHTGGSHREDQGTRGENEPLYGHAVAAVAPGVGSTGRPGWQLHRAGGRGVVPNLIVQTDIIASSPFLETSSPLGCQDAILSWLSLSFHQRPLSTFPLPILPPLNRRISQDLNWDLSSHCTLSRDRIRAVSVKNHLYTGNSSIHIFNETAAGLRLMFKFSAFLLAPLGWLTGTPKLRLPN